MFLVCVKVFHPRCTHIYQHCVISIMNAVGIYAQALNNQTLRPVYPIVSAVTTRETLSVNSAASPDKTVHPRHDRAQLSRGMRKKVAMGTHATVALYEALYDVVY